MNVLDWAANVPAGERVVYAVRRELCPARQPDPTLLHIALEASKRGLVFLAQRRKDNSFMYEATRISPDTVRRLKKINDRMCGSWKES